jgi:hypothetical protein
MDEEGQPLLLPCDQEVDGQSTMTGSILVRPDKTDQKDELPHPDSPLSDYYVPTERALTEGDTRRLDRWMIVLLGLSASVFLAVVALLYYIFHYRLTLTQDGDSGWTQAWLYRTNAPEEPALASEGESRNVNKDKMIATILVDLRLHNNARGAESLADTEEQLTESEASQGVRSESSSEFSGARSETLSELGTTLDDIAEADIQELHEEMQVIRRRRFWRSN